MKKKQKPRRRRRPSLPKDVQLVAYKARARVVYALTRDISIQVEGWDSDSMQHALARLIGERRARNVFEIVRGP